MTGPVQRLVPDAWRTQFHAPHRRARSLLLPALLGGALIVRLALLPLTQGHDFSAFARLAWLTVHGHDVYALSRAQLHTLPWTYFPPCLYLFTVLQWLTLHTGWPFRIVGKLPIVAADLAVGWLLYRTLRRQREAEAVALRGAALYLFNPLVLYNGAFYGRFDAIALAALMWALDRYHTRLFAPAYALAIAVKTFPLFLLPLLALGRDRQDLRRLALAGACLPFLALPHLITDPGGLLHNLLYHTTHLSPGRLSWYTVALQQGWLSAAQEVHLARVAAVLYLPVLLVAVRQSLYTKAALCFGLFVVLSPTVYEQYLLWGLPFLIAVALRERRLAFVVIGLLSVAGLLENEDTWRLHVLPVPTPWPELNAVLALALLVFIGITVLTGQADR